MYRAEFTNAENFLLLLFVDSSCPAIQLAFYLVFTQFWTSFDLIFDCSTLKLPIHQEKASSKENCADFDSFLGSIAINIASRFWIEDIHLHLRGCLMDINIYGYSIERKQQSQRHLHSLELLILMFLIVN